MSWFAVQTKPRYEKKIATELNKKEIDVFLPLYSSLHQWSDRRRMVELPLFPTYLFVQIAGSPESRKRVLSTSGVKNFVGPRGTASTIPESEIESVRTLLRRGVNFENYPYLSTGQRVRIRGGSLNGIEGILIAKNDDLSLIVSINIIHRSVAIRVKGYRVEAA